MFDKDKHIVVDPSVASFITQLSLDLFYTKFREAVMNEELLEHKVKIHETRINDHSNRLDKLEQNQVRVEVQIQNLCDNLKNLTSAIKWLIGLGASALVGFFFHAIQSNLF